MKDKGLYFSDSCHRCSDYGTPCHLTLFNLPNGGRGQCIKVFSPNWVYDIPVKCQGYAVHVGDGRWVGIPLNGAVYHGFYAQVVEWLQNEAGVKLDHTAANNLN